LLMDIEMVIRSTFPKLVSLTIIPHSFKYSHTQLDSITHEIKILSK